MLRSFSSERSSEKTRCQEVSEKWPKKPKVRGLKRRKSITQIDSDEIVDQIEAYICHLERTIEDQRIFIKSLLEENRTLKIKRKLKAKISEAKPISSSEQQEKDPFPRNISTKYSNEKLPTNKTVKPERPKQSLAMRHLYRSDRALIDRLMDTKNCKNIHGDEPQLRQLLPQGICNLAKTGQVRTSCSTAQKKSSVMQKPRRTKSTPKKQERKTQEPLLLHYWTDEEDNNDNLWSDY